MSLAKRCDLTLQHCILCTPLPLCSELSRSVRDRVLEAFPRLSFRGTGQGSQEVWDGLLFRTVESHIHKERFRRNGLSEEDLFPFVKDTDLVKEVVRGLRSLVDRDDAGGSHVF